MTIAGESAGGTAVGLHMISPLSRGLFHRAIMEVSVANVLVVSMKELLYGSNFTGKSNPNPKQIASKVFSLVLCII